MSSRSRILRVGGMAGAALAGVVSVSRDQRRCVYASSKREINTFGFGTDNEMEEIDSLVVFKHSPFPALPPGEGQPGAAPEYRIPAGKVLGGAHGRRHAFRPASLVNLSGMSYGSLSPVAVEALNRGAALAGCLHNTGEGGLAPAHQRGGELVFQIGTGYFGCRDEDGRFSLERLQERVAEAPVRAVEIKLSQGAKPGLGGLLPAPKVTEEIARIRTPEWPIVSERRRTEVETLIGTPAPPQPPGPGAGEQAGFPGAGDPTRSHQDLRGIGEPASEAG